MLKEVSSKKYPDKENQKWFSDEYFDVIVWMGNAADITGLQLCYDKRGSERALTWRKDGGFAHERVDDGEASPEKNRSPILIPGGACPIKELLERYAAASIQVDKHVNDFILARLKEYQAVINVPGVRS